MFKLGAILGIELLEPGADAPQLPIHEVEERLALSPKAVHATPGDEE